MEVISIIMPVFNKGKYIEQAIESVLNQSFKEFEFIIVDDGSTDESREICDKYAKQDYRIRVVHINNAGVSNARNVGLDMARGEYITFIDADDKIKKEYLKNLYDCIISSEADLVISGFQKIWEQSEKVESFVVPIRGLIELDKILPEFVKLQKETGIFGWVCAKIFRRKLCEKIRFDISLGLAEDFDFWLKLYRNIETIYFDNAQNYLYLQEAENSSMKCDDYDIDYMSQLKINLRYKEFLQSRNAFSQNNREILIKIISNYFYFTLFYCDIERFETVFINLHDIYITEKIEFVADTIMKKWILSQIKFNNEKLAKFCIKAYRKARSIYRMR